jgi:hypothetical protein
MRIDMSPHSDTLSRFRANQSLLFLINAACLAEKQQIQIYSLRFDPTGARSHDLPHRGEHANHYTTDAALENTYLMLDEYIYIL